MAIGSMTNKTYNVLFLCADNAARSIMAEALLNASTGNRFRAFSAGSHPAGAVHPFAAEQAKALGYAPADFRSKSWDEFSGPDAPSMDFVITLCDEAAGEPCPRWPGEPSTANWSFRNPATARGSEDDIRQAFFNICCEIKTRLEIFRNLPAETLDEMAIQRKIAKIARFHQ